MIAPNLQAGSALPGVFALADLACAPFLSVESVCRCIAAAVDLAQRVIIVFLLMSLRFTTPRMKGSKFSFALGV